MRIMQVKHRLHKFDLHKFLSCHMLRMHKVLEHIKLNLSKGLVWKICINFSRIKMSFCSTYEVYHIQLSALYNAVVIIPCSTICVEILHRGLDQWECPTFAKEYHQWIQCKGKVRILSYVLQLARKALFVLCYREALYVGGGVLFITSRILVVDLLKKQCPVDKVAGILVFNAHRYNTRGSWQTCNNFCIVCYI